MKRSGIENCRERVAVLYLLSFAKQGKKEPAMAAAPEASNVTAIRGIAREAFGMGSDLCRKASDSP
jgi:hypothetical protein